MSSGILISVTVGVSAYFQLIPSKPQFSIDWNSIVQRNTKQSAFIRWNAYVSENQVAEFPSKLFFFCEQEPKSGGETPIVLSHHIYNLMKEKYPDFVEKLEEHGLIYIRVLGEGDDPSSPIGRGWHSTFMTKDKVVAEERYIQLWSFFSFGGMIRLPITEAKFSKLRFKCQVFGLIFSF